MNSSLISHGIAGIAFWFLAVEPKFSPQRSLNNTEKALFPNVEIAERNRVLFSLRMSTTSAFKSFHFLSVIHPVFSVSSVVKSQTSTTSNNYNVI